MRSGSSGWKTAFLAAALAAVPVVWSQVPSYPQYPQQQYPQQPQQQPQPVAQPAPWPDQAQPLPQQNPPAAPQFSQADLDTMLAPIALYPDSLLSQVLMAATYPLEVVQASRFVQANPNLSGDSLASALAQQNWDPSVKSLVNFPTVLQMMNDKLDWTVQLGNAFLAQQQDVMDSVQRLRQQAQAAGNLQTTEEHRVEYLPPDPNAGVTTQYIVINNVNPDYCYVPVYDPVFIYGTWHYPDHRPWFWCPPNYVPTHGIWWGQRCHYGPGWGYAWGRPDWRRHDIDVDIHRHENIVIHEDRTEIIRREHDIDVHDGRGTWQHNPRHRDGISYGDSHTAERYGGRAPAADVQARQQYRGRVESNSANNPRNDRPDTPARQDRPKETPRTNDTRNDQQQTEGVNRNNVRDIPHDNNDNVNRNNVRDQNRRDDSSKDTPKAPAQREPTPPRVTEQEHARKAEPAPSPAPTPAPTPAPAPKPAPKPAPQAEPDRPTNPRATPPSGSGERGSGGDARADSARGRESRSAPPSPPPAPSPSPAPSAGSHSGGGSSGGSAGPSAGSNGSHSGGSSGGSPGANSNNNGSTSGNGGGGKR